MRKLQQNKRSDMNGIVETVRNRRDVSGVRNIESGRNFWIAKVRSLYDLCLNYIRRNEDNPIFKDIIDKLQNTCYRYDYESHRIFETNIVFPCLDDQIKYKDFYLNSDPSLRIQAKCESELVKILIRTEIMHSDEVIGELPDELKTNHDFYYSDTGFSYYTGKLVISCKKNILHIKNIEDGWVGRLSFVTISYFQ